jgi:predicted aldo/keto reductase-like oxidoreductase
MNHQHHLTRRQFIRNTTLATAGIAIGLQAAPRTVLAETDADRAAIKKTRSYNPQMEYRRLGRTGLWVSAVCMGGHWKRVDKVLGVQNTLNPYNAPTDASIVGPFERNRAEVLNYAIEAGINYIDFAGDSEGEVYSKILHDKREAVFIGYSHPASELRVPANRTTKRLLELFDAGLKRCRLDYVDIWRLMVLERGGRHSPAETDAMLEALATAKKQGKCRFTGMSTHDREWAKTVIDAHPDIIQVLCFPYTADSRELPTDSLFESLRQHDVGTFGIKPFASNAIFKGDGSPDHPEAAEDNRRAQIVIRHILSNPRITAPIPGLISTKQVDNLVAAVKERRQLDLAEKIELNNIRQEMWAKMEPDYHWLKDWRYV